MRRTFSVRSVLTAVTAACALTGPFLTPAARADQPSDGADLAAELQALWRVAACAGTPAAAALPDRANKGAFDDAVVGEHCKALGKILDNYRRDWLAPAKPFFETLVPKDVPKTVVYPFAGGDLMTALAVFPGLEDLTTISLESGGDPRGVFRVETKELTRVLKLNRQFINELVVWNHNRTLDLAQLGRTQLPAQLIFALVGLQVHGFEPVSLRVITLEKDGTVRGLTEKDFAAFDAKVSKTKGFKRNTELNVLFSNYELRFKKKDGTGPVRTYRHFMANLANDHLADNPGLMKYLEKKGTIAAMTKAASHLLWHGAFKTIREYLKQHMRWMVSDSTGISPAHLEVGKWQQTVYGKFDTAIFNPTADGQKALRALYASQPERKLPMKLFGYPTKHLNPTLIVTVPKG